MPGCARRCSIGSPIRPTLSKQVRSRTVFAGPCGRNAKSDPWRPLFHSASASPYGLRSSRTELYPLNLQRPKVGQIKPPKWAKPTCQKHHVGKEHFLHFCHARINECHLRSNPVPDIRPTGAICLVLEFLGIFPSTLRLQNCLDLIESGRKLET